MTAGEAVIVNKLGLHARPSARLTALASKFASEVWLTKNSRRVNAKSIMGVMMLAAARGSTLLIEAEGPDENEAVLALHPRAAAAADIDLAAGPRGAAARCGRHLEDMNLGARRARLDRRAAACGAEANHGDVGLDVPARHVLDAAGAGRGVVRGGLRGGGCGCRCAHAGFLVPFLCAHDHRRSARRRHPPIERYRSAAARIVGS